MSRLVWHLSKAKESEYRLWAERLQAAGADLDPSIFCATDSPKIKVTQDSLMLASYVRAFPAGSFFVMQISILALAPKVIIRDVALSSPDWDPQVDLLTDPCLTDSRAQYYRLPDGTDFHRDEVLNHRIDSDETLRRGDLLEGVLLARGLAPIPPSHPPGSCMAVNLSITDQFEDVCGTTLDLLVERPAMRAQPQRVRPGGLYHPAEAPVGVPDPSREAPVAEPSRRGSRGSGAKLDGMLGT